VHNISQWLTLRHFGEPLGGAEGLLEAVSFNLFATTPVAATGFQTTAAYYTLRGDGLLGSQTYAAL